MKKILCFIIILSFVMTISVCYANNTDIPSLTIEQLMVLSKSKQAKVDIIKKNNVEIEKYKSSLSIRLTI